MVDKVQGRYQRQPMTKKTLIIQKDKTLFGDFIGESYEIPTIERKRFAPIPEKFQGITSENVTNGMLISRYFSLSDFTAAPRTRTLLKNVTATTPDVALANLQRLCFEALDPAVQHVGSKPTIINGLASHQDGREFNYNPTIPDTKIVGDSVFESYALGTGCAIQFPEDNERRLVNFALYIQASVIYDRCTLYYSSKRRRNGDTRLDADEPWLIISVNDKMRRRTNTVKDGRIMHEGIKAIDG